MPYLRRDEDGVVTGFSQWPSGEHTEKVTDDNPELLTYLEPKTDNTQAITNPLARLMIRKGLVTAKEVNDEFKLS